MSIVNLKQDSVVFDDGLDSVVIVNCLGDIPGGCSLDVSEFEGDVVRAGHVLIKNNKTNAVKPLGVSGGNYVTLPEQHSFVGVLKVSVLKSDARAAIMTFGQVNAAASPYPLTETIKKGLPNIQFI